MTFLVGIDCGTTSIKACVYNETGQMVNLVKTDTITHYKDNFSWYEPEEIWEKIIYVIKCVLDGIDKKNIAGISVTSFGEAGVPIDKNGNPTYPIISWFNLCSLPQAKLLKNTIGKEQIFKITGLDANPIFSLPKLLWLKENEPESFSRTYKWLCLTDYIYYKLTGEMRTDYTIASRTMALDINKCCWSDELLAAVGLSVELFPRLIQSGKKVGTITVSTAKCTSLPTGTPVIAGGHDHFCGSIASGVLLGNRVLDSSGTAESIHALIKEKNELMNTYKGFRIGRFLNPEYFYIVGGLVSSGITVDWIIDRCASISDWTINSEETTDKKYYYGDVMKLVEKTKPGADGLIFIPHLRGSGAPYWDPHSKGTFIGLKSLHSSPMMIRAVIEGLCFDVRMIVEEMTKIIGHKIDTLTVIGGGAKNNFWQQVKANITGIPVEVPDVEEATAMGAALLAGVGVGIYEDIKTASCKTYKKKKRYEPKFADRELYNELYSIYKQVYPALKPINIKIDNLFDNRRYKK